MALSFYLESPVLPPTAKVIGFRGTEALSQPYVVEVYATVDGPLEIEPGAVVGLPAVLSIRDESAAALPVSYGGIIGRFQLVGATELSTLYKVTIVPRLWQLAFTKHSRVWTKMSITDVLKAVLTQEGVANFQLRVTGAYAPEEHICQYRESSLDFIHRWMEREGLYYFFEQTGAGEILVVVDSLAMHTPSLHGPVRYYPGQADGGARRHFGSFIAGASSLPAMVRVTDYDYSKPTLPIMGMSPVWPTGVGEMSESSGDARVFSPADGTRIALVRAEALRAEGSQAYATGSALGLSPGYTFLLEGHPRASLDKAYLVTRQQIVGRLADTTGWGRLPELEGSDQVLSVDIAAIGAELQYRSQRRTAWPRVDGYEVGVVDGAADSQYAQLDDTGRYLVKFKFDEGSMGVGKASTFVRMMQPHAGAVEGWHFPLRKGTEVVFLFLGGDPDRPVIAGAIPNATTPSPVTSGNYSKNVIQTGGRNRLEIEDQAGSELITLSTPYQNSFLKMGSADDHEFISTTDGRGLWNTGGNSDFTIGGQWVVDVSGSLQETVGGSVTESYSADQTTDVSGSFTETIGGGSTQTISGGATQTISGGELRTVSGGLTESISGGETRDVSGSFTESVAGAWSQTVNGSATQTTNGSATHTINGSLTQSILGGGTITTPAAYNLTATGGLNIDCAAGMKVNAPGGVQFIAPGGFTVLAPGGVRTVDSFFESHGGFRAVRFGMTLTMTGLETKLTGASIGGTMLKAEAVGFSAKYAGAEWANKLFETKSGGFKLSNFGLSVWHQALGIFT